MGRGDRVIANPAARTIATFDLAAGQQPENFIPAADGGFDVNFGFNRQVAYVSAKGQVSVLATMPLSDSLSKSPIGKAFLGGMVRAGGSLYVNYTTGFAADDGIWRIGPNGQPTRISAFPVSSLLNGLALDPRTGYLYAADSLASVIRRVPLAGGTPVAWATGSALARTNNLGANGIKVHDGAVWVSNTDNGTLLRIPIDRDGGAGPIQTWASGLPTIDDFAFTGHGDTVAIALDEDNKVVLLSDHRIVRTILSAGDGISNPSSIVPLRGDTIAVASTAYFTNSDPNLLTVRGPGL